MKYVLIFIKLIAVASKIIVRVNKKDGHMSWGKYTSQSQRRRHNCPTMGQNYHIQTARCVVLSK